MMRREYDASSAAIEYTNRITLQPCIVVLMGLPLVGKTTLGLKLASITNGRLLDVENARYPEGTPKQYKPRGTEEAERFAMETAYRRNHEWAADALSRNEPVILVATYSRPSYHQMLITLAEQTKREMVVFRITAADEAIPERIEERIRTGSLSNIRTLNDYESVKERFEIPQFTHYVVDTRLDPDGCVEKILLQLEPYTQTP